MIKLEKSKNLLEYFSFKSEKGFYRLLFWPSLFVIVAVGSYGIIATMVLGGEVVGSVLVNVEFPSMEMSPFFFMKPITWFYISVVTFFYSWLELGKDWLGRRSRVLINFTKFLAVLMAAVSLYEIVFTISLWSGLMASDSVLGKLNPDIIINPFPNSKTPWNLVFASKTWTLIIFVSVYYLYSLSRNGIDNFRK